MTSAILAMLHPRAFEISMLCTIPACHIFEHISCPPHIVMSFMVQQTNILKAWNANKDEEKNGAYPMLNEKTAGNPKPARHIFNTRKICN